jgi:hypothetical protein
MGDLYIYPNLMVHDVTSRFYMVKNLLSETNVGDDSIAKRKITCKLYSFIEVKGKAIPLQAWTDPECSRRLRLPDFKTIGPRRW